MSTTSPRQLRILQLLPRSPRKTTVEALAERLLDLGFEVSTRTVRRDLEDLASVHRIERDGAKPEGWCFVRGADALLPPMLDDDTALVFSIVEEFATPLLPPRALRHMRPYFEHARRVLARCPTPGVRDWLRVIRSVTPGLALRPAPIDPQVHDAVYEAVSRKRQFRVRYENARKQVKDHVVHPLALVVRGPQRYVLAAVRAAAEPIQLALSRMREAEPLPEEATTPAGFDLDAYIGEGNLDIPVAPGLIALRFAIRRAVGGFLFDTRMADDQRVSPRDGEWLLVEATVPNTFELRAFLLRFAADLEVIAPAELREEMAAIGRSLVARHVTSGVTTAR